jgi:deazaflavin-dependent oxidoreductase (nitroreductase family)
MRLLTPLAVLIGGRPWLPRFARWIVGFDRLIQRLSAGRLTLLMLAGLPELMLTVPGRTSGISRSTPLLYVPHPRGHLVAGSNWGAPKPPAWVANLRAAKTARVRLRGRTQTVVPQLVEGPERDELWQHMLRTWPNYAKYAERTDRVIPVFCLEPAG